MASPRRNPSSFRLTDSRPGIDGASRGLITGAVFKAARESTGLTQQDLAEGLAIDKTTVQGWETGRRPLTSARAGTLVAVRNELLDMAANPSLIGSIDTAMQADQILDRLLDGDPADARHPLATRVLPQPLAVLLAWSLKETPPHMVSAVARSPRRGPVATGALLGAADRRRLITNLRRTAENPPERHASLVRRQAAYLASFDHNADTTEWLSDLRRSVRWSGRMDGFSPSWAEARSVAIALDRQGDRDAVARFVAGGEGADAWEAANLNYWAYWVGETLTIERDDSFMGARVGRWRGLRLLDHLTARVRPGSPDLALNVHTVWALLVARRGLLDDDPDLTAALAQQIRRLLDEPGIPATIRADAESIRSALRLNGVAA